MVVYNLMFADMGVRRNFSRGGQRQHFANPCQVADDAIQMYVHETLYRFYTTTQQRKRPVLRQQSQKMGWQPLPVILRKFSQ